MTQHEISIRSRIRRLYVPDAIFFITSVTHKRERLFTNGDNVTLLRRTLHTVKSIHPFKMRAYVFLPDHFHLLIHVGPTTDISKILHSIKRNFTRDYKRLNGVSDAGTLWQRGFWDHVIRNERDYTNHANYIHFNPVKHGLVIRPMDYKHSSFQYYVRAGWYESDWGTVEPDELRSMSLE